MNISSKDRMLGNQINLMMKEYDDISKNLYESKNQYLLSSHPSQYSIHSFNYLNRNNYYNSHFNDPDLQSRITNSLYPNRNRAKNIPVYTPSNMTTLNNINMNLNYMPNNTFRKSLNSKNVIDDFKTTLMQTQAITNKIMTKDNFFKNRNFNNNIFNKNINYDTSDLSNNSLENSILSEENDSSINLDDLSDELKNLEEENNVNDFNYKLSYRKKNNNDNMNMNMNFNIKTDNIYNINKREEENLKSSNQILKKSNQDLRNNNRILEVEITNYKVQKNNLNGNNNLYSHFDENLQKFLNKEKNDFKDYINKNTKLIDQIFDIHKEIQKILEKKKKLTDEYSKIAAKIEEENRKNAEKQWMNEENEKKIEMLTEEKNNLNHDIEKLKIELINLKNKENNLKILNESNLKKKKDNHELVTKLNNTIKQLNSEKTSTNEKTKLNNQKNKNAIFTLNLYEKKINDLKASIENINKEKNDIMEKNSNMNIELKTNKNNINKEDLEKERKLKEEMNDLKLENDKKQNDIAEKEIIIQTLQQYVDKLSNAITNEDKISEIEKINFEEIIKDYPEDEKENTGENNTEDTKIRQEIRKTLDEIIIKENEINKMTKMYDDILNQKDGIINSLEQQINTSSDKIPNITNKDKINNNINDNDMNNMEINNNNDINDINNEMNNLNINNNINIINNEASINELNIDSENNNEINNNILINENNMNEINNNNYNINNMNNKEIMNEENNNMNEINDFDYFENIK